MEEVGGALRELVQERTQKLVDTVKVWTDQFNKLMEKSGGDDNYNYNENEIVMIERGTRTSFIIQHYQLARDNYNESPRAFGDLGDYSDALKNIMNEYKIK